MLKSADPTPQIDLHAQPGNAHTDAAMANLLRMFLLAGAAGGLGRTAIGMRDFWNRNTQAPRHAAPRHTAIPLPYAVPEKLAAEEQPSEFHVSPPEAHTPGMGHPEPLVPVLGGADPEEHGIDHGDAGERGPATYAEKAAHVLELLKQSAEVAKGPVQQAAEWLTENLGLMHNPSGNNSNWFKDRFVPQDVKNMWDMPWAVTAAPLVVGGGAMAGWKGMDNVLHKSKDREEESELATAKQRFENALLAQSPLKTAAYHGLDELAAQAEAGGFEKQAFEPLNALLSMYGLAALGTAVPSAYLAHKYFADASPDKALEEALKRRRLMLHQAAPRPFVARPVPVEVETPEEDED